MGKQFVFLLYWQEIVFRLSSEIGPNGEFEIPTNEKRRKTTEVILKANRS